MRHVVVALAIALMPVSAQAQDFDAGLAAYREGDYAAALQEWRPLAEQGDAVAQTNIGFMYRRGDGVQQDYAEAVRWVRLSAEQGIASAQNKLGYAYYTGEGVPQDYVTSHMWFNIAAANGADDATANRDTVANQMTAADISEAQRRARVCMASGYEDCD